MKMFQIALISFFILIAGTGCKKPKVELDNNDLKLAAVTGISKDLLLKAKIECKNIHQLEGMDADGNKTKAPGLTIDVPEKKVSSVVSRLQAVASSDYIVYVSDRNYGIGGDPDKVSVMKAANFFEVLKVMGTNGWNYDISPEMVIDRIKKWDERFGLTLTGAGFDWFEAEFQRPPEDMMGFAKEVYEFCPDVVDQGTGTIEELAKEMKRYNRVFLWWD